jgi:hypothetical protein
MTLFEIEHDKSDARPRRNWIAETLIVAGILVFGAFALLAEAPRNAVAPLGQFTQTAVNH